MKILPQNLHQQCDPLIQKQVTNIIVRCNIMLILIAGKSQTEETEAAQSMSAQETNLGMYLQFITCSYASVSTYYSNCMLEGYS